MSARPSHGAEVATCGVRARPRRPLAALGSVAVATVGVVGCSAEREAGPGGLPGDSLAPGEATLEIGTVAPGDQPFVDGLATNFTDGGRLVARLDAEPAACVAQRWVAVLGAAGLQAAGIEAAAMVDVTLERLAEAVAIDEPMARALVASYAACGADQTDAFLDSLLLTSQITPDQRVCLATELPDGLIGAITVSVLTQDRLDDSLAAQYAAALDACPSS
jgi:hypothetical protein